MEHNVAGAMTHLPYKCVCVFGDGAEGILLWVKFGSLKITGGVKPAPVRRLLTCWLARCARWQSVSQTNVPKCIHTRPESDKTSSILLKRGRFYLVAPSVKTFCFAL